MGISSLRNSRASKHFSFEISINSFSIFVIIVKDPLNSTINSKQDSFISIHQFLIDSLYDCIIFSCMQQSENQPDDLLHQLLLFSDFLSKTLCFFQNYGSRVSDKISGYRYPLSCYSNGWKMLADSMKNQLKQLKQNRGEVLVSTIINWAMPTLCAGYNDLYVFIEKNRSQPRQSFQEKESFYNEFKGLIEEFSLQSSFKTQIIGVQSILQVPFVYVERLKEQILALLQATEIREAQLGSLADQLSYSQQTIIKKKIQLMQIEKRELGCSLKNLGQHIEFLNRSDKNLNRDTSVLKHRIINEQYPQLSKSKHIMKFVFRVKLLSKWNQLKKRIAKRLIQRKNKINELIDAQKRYIQGLTEYISMIKQPICAVQRITQQEKRLLFSSVEEIRDFHKDMYSVLSKEFQNYNQNQCYGKILKIFIPFFKLYTDYILNATVAQKTLQDLSKSDKQVGEICRKYTQATKKIAHNELSQPTFRIARYQAHFESIIKNTRKSHPDYKLLTDILKTFNTILTQVNNEVDKIIRRTRLNQIQNDYGTIQNPTFQGKREFLAEYSLTFIKQPKSEQVLLIICNDLLLIIQEQSKKIIRPILVDKNFFARREEDNKTYKNMVTIHSDGLMTFSVGSQQINVNKTVQLYQTLKKITKDTGEQVVVQVVGTQQIGSTSFAKYTQYIIEVKLRDMKKLLHMRFSKVTQMVGIMQNHYKNDLKITEAEGLRKSWFNSHKSKTIQDRKITIAQIFMKLFNHQLIKKVPEYFLIYLNLPQNFYDIAQSAYQKRLSMGQSVTISGLKRSYLTKRQEKEMFTILCGTQIELGRDLFHDNDNNQQLKKLKDDAQKIEIQILTLTEREPVKIKITNYDTVQDACNKVSTLIGLRSNRDFRLFHQIGKKELRVLDHEQILTKIFQFPKSKNDLIVGTYQNIKSTLNRIFSPETQPTLIFKKYYYLPFDIQLAQVKKDLTRLRLMVYQVFTEVCDMKYQLNFDQYLLFLAMLIYIELQGKIQNSKQIQQTIVHRIIPPTVFKLKNYSEQEWISKSEHHLLRIHQEIEKVIEYNRSQLKADKIKADTVSKMSLYFGHKHLCSQIVINKIKTKPIFGSNLFYVQPHSSCYKKLEDQGRNVAYNMWLAVKLQSLDLLTPSSKQSVLELKYNQIQKVTVFSESIVIRTAGAFEIDYRLNTYQSFEISQLIKYYKALNNTLVKIKESSELNARVKQYRQQLIQYRVTYEGANQSYSMIK